jgi:hypothetical protein
MIHRPLALILMRTCMGHTNEGRHLAQQFLPYVLLSPTLSEKKQNKTKTKNKNKTHLGLQS